MIQEENVDVETTLTEQIAEAKEKEGLTVLGKFKDVDALTRAYESLQAEFTRRSQRLRSLEKELENFKTESGEAATVEKLRKTARARREEAKKFDAFVAEVDGGESGFENGEKEIAQAADEPAKLEPSFQEESPRTEEAPARGGGREEEGETKTPFIENGESVSPLPSEALFQQAFANEGVRLRIVGEYLASLGKAGAPITSGGGGVLTTPPLRAKTVGQAGDMALLYFKKPRE